MRVILNLFSFSPVKQLTSHVDSMHLMTTLKYDLFFYPLINTIRIHFLLYELLTSSLAPSQTNSSSSSQISTLRYKSEHMLTHQKLTTALRIRPNTLLWFKYMSQPVFQEFSTNDYHLSVIHPKIICLSWKLKKHYKISKETKSEIYRDYVVAEEEPNAICRPKIQEAGKFIGKFRSLH